MVGIDTNSNKCTRSCTCSYTSILYSEIVTETEFSPISSGTLKNAETGGRSSKSPKCTCLHSRHKVPPVPVIYDVRDGPLSTTTRRPLPLPLTPTNSRKPINSGYREPDCRQRERTLISTFGGKPFVPQEPQRIYYARSNPKHVGEFFTSSVEETVVLKKNEVQKAEFMIVTDSLKTPFQSVIYMKGDRMVEYFPDVVNTAVEKTTSGSVASTSTKSVKSSQKALEKTATENVGLTSAKSVMSSQRAMEKTTTETVGSLTTKSVKSSQRLQYFIHAMPCDAIDLLEDVNNDYASLYRAMGPTASSNSSQFMKRSDNSADVMVSLWNKICGSNIALNSITEDSSWEQPLSEDGAFRSCSEDQLTELSGVPSYSIAVSAPTGSMSEWWDEIARLREFLNAERSISNLSCSTAKTIPLPHRGNKKPSPGAPPSVLEVPKKSKEWKLRRMTTGGKKAIVTWAKNTFGKNKKK